MLMSIGNNYMPIKGEKGRQKGWIQTSAAWMWGLQTSKPGNPGVWRQCRKNLLLSGKMASNVEAPERWYLALLGFAEHFRTSSPPKIRLCVHCLQAVFQFKPPQRIEARTHLQLGSVLYHHTKNSELARSHLEKAVRDARCRKERGCVWDGVGSRPNAVVSGERRKFVHFFPLGKANVVWKFKM